MELKIVSFNMKRTLVPKFKNHWNNRTDAICDFFASQSPDIVGTQEMLYPYIQASQELLPDYGYVGEGRKGGNEGEYTAIFYKKSRLRVVDWGTFWLSRTPEVPSRSWLSLFPRTCTWAIFESLQDGSRIRVYNTHLDHISMFARLYGLQLIREHIVSHAVDCADCVLMGDFNATPTSRPLLQMHQREPQEQSGVTLRTVDLPGCTYHGFRGRVAGRPIDYIFTSDTMHVLEGYIDRRTYKSRYPSDHYPLVMRVSTARV